MNENFKNFPTPQCSQPEANACSSTPSDPLNRGPPQSLSKILAPKDNKQPDLKTSGGSYSGRSTKGQGAEGGKGFRL